jgi:hypothetical protein
MVNSTRGLPAPSPLPERATSSVLFMSAPAYTGKTTSGTPSPSTSPTAGLAMTLP